MPDPLLYLAAVGAAALASALLVAAIACRPTARRNEETRSTRRHIAVLVGIAGGLLAGYWVLDLYVSWPPVNALDRFLTIILPLAVAIELSAAVERVPRWLAWTLQVGLVVAMAPVLLHGSVYLSGAYSLWQIVLIQAACALLIGALWMLLSILAARPRYGILIPAALAFATIVSGLVIMISGYVSGGAATLPLAAALVAGVAVDAMQTRQPYLAGAIGIGVVGLSGLLFIGRFFGGLSTSVALVLLLSPLLCWAAQLLPLFLRDRLAEDSDGRPAG